MIQAKNNTVSVSIDVGADTAKAAYAYVDTNGKYVYKLLFEDGEGIPSLAYYNEREGEWIFGRKEINNAAESSFRFLVKIKDLLNLFHTRASNGLYGRKKLFKNFYYPPKENETYEEAVENGRCFEAKHTPRQVCALFFRYCVNRIQKEIADIFGNVTIKYVVVYPAHAEKAYIDELVSFISHAAKDEKNVMILSAPKSVGVSALEYGVINKEKNVLLFNVGEDEISVVKIRFDQNNICVYSAEGHNAPTAIGGKNVDVALAGRLFEKSDVISSFGASGEGGERGGFHDQFLMQQGVKAGKRIFSDGRSYRRLGNNVTFSIYREMITTVKMTQEEFLLCCKEVFKTIWSYVESELMRPDNDDVEAIIFSGGAADTFGLGKYISAKLQQSVFSEVKFLDFSPENEEQGYDDVLCASKDTVPIGAALFGAGKYTFNIITTCSYGTWTNSRINGEVTYLYNEFIAKGMSIEISGDANFAAELLSSKAYAGDACSRTEGKKNGLKKKEYYRHNGNLLIFNEYYKCDAGEYYDLMGRKRRYDSKNPNDYIVLKYVPEREMRVDAPEHTTFEGEGSFGGVETDVHFDVIGYYLMVYEFPENFQGDQVEVIKKIYFKEGFEIDCEGRATPIVRNVSKEYYKEKKMLSDYRDLYQNVKIYLVPNGTEAMDIND